MNQPLAQGLQRSHPKVTPGNGKQDVVMARLIYRRQLRNGGGKSSITPIQERLPTCKITAGRRKYHETGREESLPHQGRSVISANFTVMLTGLCTRLR